MPQIYFRESFTIKYFREWDCKLTTNQKAKYYNK